MAEGDIFLMVEATFGSHLYRQALALREAVLRAPLGLTHTEDELSDDAMCQHFCAVRLARWSARFPCGRLTRRPCNSSRGRRRDAATGRRRDAAEGGYQLMVIHARAGAEEFYARFDFASEGYPFEETTLPHVRMTKRLVGAGSR